MKTVNRTLWQVLVAIALFGCSAAATAAPTFAVVKQGEQEVTIESLRKSVQREFEGFGQFDESEELALSDQISEHRAVLPCRSVAEVIDAIRGVFPTLGLHEFAVSRQYPRNAVYFRRASSPEAGRDIVNFYFLLQKGTGLDCNFTFGAFAKTVISRKSEFVKSKDQLFQKLIADIASAISSIESRLKKPRAGALFEPRPATVSETQNKALQLLRDRGHRDNIADKAVERAQAMLKRELVDYGAKNVDIDMFVVKMEEPPPAELEKFRTRNCIAVPHDLPRPTIVCNADYIAEIEAVLRFFEDPRSGIRSTDGLKFLARRFSDDAVRTLSRLRANEEFRKLNGQDDEHVIDHMSMAMLYVLSHEVGHLLSPDSDSNAAIDSVPLDSTPSYRAAILRLCKHADYFKSSNFYLDMFDEIVIDPTSQQRGFIDKFKAQDKQLESTERMFREEALADLFATDFSLKYFARLGRNDKESAAYQQYLFLENVEALATYFWYRSYFQFADSVCQGVHNTAQFSACLGLDTANWIAASDVFGRSHRNFLLRAVETFSVFVAERTTFYDIPLADRIVAPDDEALRAMLETDRQAAVRVISTLQRHFFLRELVDTPLKLAYTGCTIGWAKEVSGNNNAPGMIMNFLSYEEEMERLTRKLSGQ
ncbi:hypothetical protein ASE11_09010 [Hydrogenophaga sp. Root209]|uniref:hypothetical protein n=1 Tax=Hydrogenophaga sp. Root209 TaxID=1736490 RepID=UPI0006FFE1E8|nr:hypothetical protein [Hydrogenophaga sp. Root209]KRB99801.1 hypothetical protein ASE11_09010 [Hydrogenophaga sp. Root209]